MATPELTYGDSERESAAIRVLSSLRASQAFADNSAGSDYFRADEHHRHLAALILRQLEKCDGFLLVSGEPPASSELLERFLNESRDHQRPATFVRCRPSMSFRDIVRAYNRGLCLRQVGGSDGVWSLLSELMLEVRKGVKRILILDNAEALDAAALEELVRFTRLDEPHVMSVVLLGGHRFGEQLNAPPFDFIAPLIIARIPSNRLGPEEVDAFIRHQLIAESEDNKVLFPPETVSAISAAAGGDPAIVNTLCRELLPEPAGRPDPATPAVTLPQMRANPLAPAQMRREAMAEPTSPSPEEEQLICQPSRPTALKPRARLHVQVSLIVGFLTVSLTGLGLLYFFGPPALPERPVLVSVWSAAQRAWSPTPAIDSSRSRESTVDKAAPSAAAEASAAVEPAAGGPSDITAQSAHEIVASPPMIADTKQSKFTPGAAQSEISARNGEDETAHTATPVNPTGLADRARIATAEPPALTRRAPKPEAPTAAPGIAAELAVPSQDAPSTALAGAPALDAMALPGSVEHRVTSVEGTPAPATRARDAASADLALMVRRGDELLSMGDVISARGFFERGAEAGDAAALCGLAKTYDTLFLRQLGARGVSGDAATAIAWYRRAAAAGSAEASMRLARLQAITSH